MLLGAHRYGLNNLNNNIIVLFYLCLNPILTVYLKLMLYLNSCIDALMHMLGYLDQSHWNGAIRSDEWDHSDEVRKELISLEKAFNDYWGYSDE